MNPTRTPERMAELAALRGPTLSPEERLERERERNQTRSARQRTVRSKTVHPSRTPQYMREHQRLQEPDTDHPRPLTRGDCVDSKRPCPYVGCRWNLYLDVSPKTGSIKLNFPDLEPDEMPPRGSCSLDIAGLGGLDLPSIGVLMNFTRERARQLEEMALRKLDAAGGRELGDYAPEGVRRLPVLGGSL